MGYRCSGRRGTCQSSRRTPPQWPIHGPHPSHGSNFRRNPQGIRYLQRGELLLTTPSRRPFYRPPGNPVLVGSYTFGRYQSGIPTHRYGAEAPPTYQLTGQSSSQSPVDILRNLPALTPTPGSSTAMVRDSFGDIFTLTSGVEPNSRAILTWNISNVTDAMSTARPLWHSSTI